MLAFEMSARGPWLLALGLGAALAACESDDWLRARGVLAFREVEVAEARRLLAEPEGLLVQVADREGSGARVASARLVLADGPLPPTLHEECETVVVLASDPRDARGLAARLVRAGVPRVAVVRGGIEAWREADAARALARSTRF